jgi:hypothetical protein
LVNGSVVDRRLPTSAFLSREEEKAKFIIPEDWLCRVSDLSTSLLDLDVENTTSIAQSSKSSPLLMLLCQG